MGEESGDWNPKGLGKTKGWNVEMPLALAGF